MNGVSARVSTLHMREQNAKGLPSLPKPFKRISNDTRGFLGEKIGKPEVLFIQMRIKMFVEGDERELNALYSRTGPVFNKKEAAHFSTRNHAAPFLSLISTQKTVGYKVLSAETVPESKVNISASRVATEG